MLFTSHNTIAYIDYTHSATMAGRLTVVVTYLLLACLGKGPGFAIMCNIVGLLHKGLYLTLGSSQWIFTCVDTTAYLNKKTKLQ